MDRFDGKGNAVADYFGRTVLLPATPTQTMKLLLWLTLGGQKPLPGGVTMSVSSSSPVELATM
jgi:hypothetical protein